MSQDKLIELAERCEKATGPDLDLDHEIGRALSANGNYSYRPYTHSLDAAMTLVPNGCTQPSDIVREALNALGKHFSMHVMHWPLITPYGEYLARFVAAAALRARSQSTPGILRSGD